MANPGKTEAFPPLSPIPEANRNGYSSSSTVNKPRPRRTSSNLGADPRGDTGATSIATSRLSQQQHIDSQKQMKSGKRTKKAKSLFMRWKRMSLKHTWVNPLVLVLVILGAYFVNPGEQNPLHPAIFLSYANPPLNERTYTLPAHIGNVTQYGKGRKDFAFVAFYTIVLSFTREFLMQRMIRPIALWFGIKNRGKQARFMEQFYTAIYFGIFGPYGLYVMSRSPVWYFNTVGMYEGFPHRSHEALFKAYYLLQAAYWAQQGLVLLLQLEKPRKDFKELVLHHIITLALIGLSYRFHFTYMGIAVYITHDISDFFLATSKILNYIDSPITGPYFAMFMCIWAYLRHYLNIRILITLLPGGQFTTVGPFDLNWDTQQYKCWIAQAITLPLIASLQAINIFWFFLITRILYRYLTTGEEKDERSEDEEDEKELDMVEGTAAESITPKVVLNGEPMQQSTGVQTRSAAARKR